MKVPRIFYFYTFLFVFGCGVSYGFGIKPGREWVWPTVGALYVVGWAGYFWSHRTYKK